MDGSTLLLHSVVLSLACVVSDHGRIRLTNCVAAQVWDAVSEALLQQTRAVDRKLSVLRLQTTGVPSLPDLPHLGHASSHLQCIIGFQHL